MIRVEPVGGKAQLKKFVQFKIDLYKGNPYSVPPLIGDEVGTLSPEKNPALAFCEAQCFMAYNEKREAVGRICAIINHRANETWGKKTGRFGFFDTIEDFQVAKALIDTASRWLMERGMHEMVGPLGFTDMDEEGMLIEGFDEIGTMATLYNYPYYPEFIERMGFVKDVDWVEFLLTVPYPIHERIVKFADIVEKKFDLTVIRPKSAHQMIKQGWGNKIFELINVSYSNLYEFSRLDQRQIDHYVKLYLPMARVELISMVADKEGNLVAFGISLPSLSKALQRANGKMFPFGWFHMLKALKKRKVDVVDLMLIAIHPDYQNKGLTAIIMNEVIQGQHKVGARFSESNPELETNDAMQKQWDLFEKRQHKRRRAYRKDLTEQ